MEKLKKKLVRKQVISLLLIAVVIAVSAITIVFSNNRQTIFSRAEDNSCPCANQESCHDNRWCGNDCRYHDDQNYRCNLQPSPTGSNHCGCENIESCVNGRWCGNDCNYKDYMNYRCNMDPTPTGTRECTPIKQCIGNRWCGDDGRFHDDQNVNRGCINPTLPPPTAAPTDLPPTNPTPTTRPPTNPTPTTRPPTNPTPTITKAGCVSIDSVCLGDTINSPGSCCTPLKCCYDANRQKSFCKNNCLPVLSPTPICEWSKSCDFFPGVTGSNKYYSRDDKVNFFANRDCTPPAISYRNVEYYCRSGSGVITATPTPISKNCFNLCCSFKCMNYGYPESNRVYYQSEVSRSKWPNCRVLNNITCPNDMGIMDYYVSESCSGNRLPASQIKEYCEGTILTPLLPTPTPTEKVFRSFPLPYDQTLKCTSCEEFMKLKGVTKAEAHCIFDVKCFYQEK